MSEPMKIRATIQSGVADIKVLINHPMETGQRKDEAGKLVPAHFVQNMTITVGGKVVVDGRMSTSVAKSPVLGFKVKGPKVGDEVVITWKDNTGATRTDKAVIA